MGVIRGSLRAATRLLVVAALSAPVAVPLAAQKPAPNAPKQKKVKEPLDSAKLAKKKAEADARALFKSQEPLVIKLVSDYKVVNGERDSLKAKPAPGTLIIKDNSGAEKKIPVTLSARGHFRRQNRNCQFVPLTVDFPKDSAKNTIFEGMGKFKLGTHCRPTPEYENYVLREHVAYRVQNMLTDRSFRTRLAKVTYDDSVSGKSLGEHNALVFEGDDDVAARMGGQIVELPHALFDDVDANQINAVSVFEFFAGNTDWSMYALHNIKLVRTADGTLLPVAYDLDFTGLVDTKYAIPAMLYQQELRSTKDRKYMGPCRTVEEISAVLGPYRDKQTDILALYDTFPGLDQGYVRNAKAFINDFYKTIKSPRDVKTNFVDACMGKPSI